MLNASLRAELRQVALSRPSSLARLQTDETVKRIIEMLTQIDAEKYGDLTFKERSGKWAKAA